MQAVTWYRKAADAGNVSAMDRLGEAYETGQGGLPKDAAQAANWYRKAAQLGNSEAKAALVRLGK